jgi:TPR repeat protein
MKANFWALIVSLFLARTAETQQAAFPTATNSLATNTPAKIAEVRAKAEKGDAPAQSEIGLMYEMSGLVCYDSALHQAAKGDEKKVWQAAELR